MSRFPLPPSTIISGLLLLFVLAAAGCRQEHQIPLEDDGRIWPDSAWQHSSYLERGMDSTMILELVDSLREFRFGAIHSLLVVKDGYLVTEEYFGSDGIESARPVTDISASILSALVGIAIDREELPDVDTRLSVLFPAYRKELEGSSFKSIMTMEHLLRMNCGLVWQHGEDVNDTESDYARMFRSEQPLGYFLQRPAMFPPGQEFAYNSGCYFMTSNILANAVGVPIEEYAKRHLFEKIGITSAEWLHNGDIADGGYGITITSRDLARFGLLYARGGMWRAEHVVPATWVIRSTHSTMVVDTTGPLTEKYGYHWWIMEFDEPHVQQKLPNGILMALGSGEELVCVVPDMDLVIVMSCSKLYENFHSRSPVLAINYIFPAIFGFPMPPELSAEEKEEPKPEEEISDEEELTPLQQGT